MMPKLILAVTFLFASLLTGPAWAKVYIDLAAPAHRRVPAAVQEFKDLGKPPAAGEKAQRDEIARELRDAVITDLRFSGFFEVLPKEAHLEDASKGISAEETNFRDWRAIGAEALVKGSFLLEGDRLTVEVRFFDTVSERQVMGKRLAGSARNPRRIVHYFSDAVYEELSGSKGVFTTKLLFVSGAGGSKEIYISDYDGRNAAKLTRNRSINLSPQWSPDGRRMLYVSYKKGSPQMYMLDLLTGREEPLSTLPGINISGRFSPDGTKVALTMSGKNSPELYVLDLSTRGYRKLTENHAIDVSPSWSPDGGRLAYVSDSSGNPHIHVLDLVTGSSKRITYNGKYNASPSWSPDGRQIAFARSDSGKFNIWVAEPDGTGLRQLTFEGDNRNPSWSPDGRHIVYSTTARSGGALAIMRSDGTNTMRLSTGVGGEKAPAWSPHLR